MVVRWDPFAHIFMETLPFTRPGIFVGSDQREGTLNQCGILVLKFFGLKFQCFFQEFLFVAKVIIMHRNT
jgi:hypothetical protein